MQPGETQEQLRIVIADVVSVKFQLSKIFTLMQCFYDVGGERTVACPYARAKVGAVLEAL
jgi:hypothetical protein